MTDNNKNFDPFKECESANESYTPAKAIRPTVNVEPKSSTQATPILSEKPKDGK